MAYFWTETYSCVIKQQCFINEVVFDWSTIAVYPLYCVSWRTVTVWYCSSLCEEEWRQDQGNIKASAASEQLLEEASVCSSWWLLGVPLPAEYNKVHPRVSAEVHAVPEEARAVEVTEADLKSWQHTLNGRMKKILALLWRVRSWLPVLWRRCPDGRCVIDVDHFMDRCLKLQHEVEAVTAPHKAVFGLCVFLYSTCVNMHLSYVYTYTFIWSLMLQL